MGWITVGSVSTDHLRSQEEIAWIETNGEANLEKFIEIKAGDIYRLTVTDGYTVAVEALRLLASEEAKGYWSGDIDFSFEAR